MMEVPVPAPGLYAMVLAWFNALGYPAHLTARNALAWHIATVLAAQSLRPADRTRSFLNAVAVPACQRFRRMARALTRLAFSPTALTPVLVPAVLALVRGFRKGVVFLALDSLRCGRWEIFVVGLVWKSRTIPVAWAVVPYPWPHGVVTTKVVALVRSVAAVWPAGYGVPHLLADRGMPSKRLFQALAEAHWGWTIRLGARSWVVTDTYDGVVGGLLDDAGPEVREWAATFGKRRGATAARLVVRRPGQAEPPRHQRGPASRRRHAQQRAQRLRDVRDKHLGSPGAMVTDGWMALFTTMATPQAALAAYRRRWAIEGSFRDAQSGWDGHHGWDLEPLVTRQTDAEKVARLVGLWALSSLVQTWVGDQVVMGPKTVRQTAEQWTTSQRVSVWGRGRFALTETHGGFTTWLQMTMNRGAGLLAASVQQRHADVRSSGTKAA